VKLSGRRGTRSAGSEEAASSASGSGITKWSMVEVSARARGDEEVVKVCIRGTVRVRDGTGCGRCEGRVEMCRVLDCMCVLDFSLVDGWRGLEHTSWLST
jgi:hypothetical protein